MLTIFYTTCAYIAVSVFVFGVLRKVWFYAKSPPLKIPLTSAPKTDMGAGLRLAKEMGTFVSLLYSDRLLWTAGVLFHFSLFLILLSHLRLFFPTIEIFVKYQSLFSCIKPVVVSAFLGSLLFLLLRRFASRKMFWLSLMEDYILLFLILAIAISGVIMNETSTDIMEIKLFVLGLVSFSPQPFPASSEGFIIHFTFFLMLLFYFPFSKLMHSFGVFFSPTKAEKDDIRER
jgi:nitrate reductase gamma subunit